MVHRRRTGVSRAADGSDRGGASEAPTSDSPRPSPRRGMGGERAPHAMSRRATRRRRWTNTGSDGPAAAPRRQRSLRESLARDVRGAVALVDVAERWTARTRTRAVVAYHLELRVAPIGRPHGPHVWLGRQDVREEPVGVPAGDRGIAWIARVLGRHVAVGGHGADVLEA